MTALKNCYLKQAECPLDLNHAKTLCEHAMGNYRVLCVMAGELLATAAQKELTQLDEKLFFDCFAQISPPTKRQRT